MVNWKSLDAKDRLLAALVAAHPDKKLLDYRRIATYYGKGTTYDSIEGQFRIIRREAALLRNAVKSGEHEQAPPRGGATPRAKAKAPGKAATATPGARAGAVGKSASNKNLMDNNVSKNLNLTHGVISGRITKSTSPPNMRKGPPATTTTPTPQAGAQRERWEQQYGQSNQIMGVDEDILSSESGILAPEEDDDPLSFPDLSLDLDSFGDEWTVPFAIE